MTEINEDDQMEKSLLSERVRIRTSYSNLELNHEVREASSFAFKYLLLMNVVINLPEGLIPSMLDVFQDKFHLSSVQMGLLGGIYCCAFTCIAPFTGRIIKSVKSYVKALLVFILFLKTILFAALSFAAFRPELVGPMGLIAIIGGLGLTANFPYTISRVWVNAFAKDEQRYSWWSKLSLMMVIGIVLGYFIGFCSWSRLDIALTIISSFSAIITLRMSTLSFSHLDVNSIQERLDRTSHEWFKPTLSWILAVICRAGFSFTCRGVFYWLTIWLIERYGISQWEAQMIFMFIAISSPVAGVALAGTIGDYFTKRNTGREEKTLYQISYIVFGFTFIICVLSPGAMSFARLELLCPSLWIGFFLGSLSATLIQVICLQVVNPRHRSVADGSAEFLIGLLGYTPAQVVVGVIKEHNENLAWNINFVGFYIALLALGPLTMTLRNQMIATASEG